MKSNRIAELERELADLTLRVIRIEARHRRLDEGLREMLEAEGEAPAWEVRPAPSHLRGEPEPEDL